MPVLIYAGYYIARMQQMTPTPPPYLGSKKALYPHNFSHQKSRKKSPWPDWKKISEKICEKMFRGKRKAPNLVERGRGVLKYERIKLGAKIVELFGNARG